MSDARQERLADFVAWARQNVTGDEKGQAQIFLDRLFQAFGQRGSLDVCGAPECRIRKATEDGGGTAFADYFWKPVVLIEMKKRGVNLAQHFRQAFDYWVRLVPDRPQYAVLSNFDEFHVYDFNVQMDSPVDTVRLEELPERYGPLAFLFPTNEKPVFGNDQEAVTRKAADLLLDPACGSGNSLYIAYRELKRLEVRAYQRLAELSKRRQSQQGVFGFVTAEQFYGMDVNPFAVELAKVTMMIGRKLSIDELHITEPALPLDNLDANFLAGDALISPQGNLPAWPEADVIIGNPPFLGAKRLKPEHGPDYVNAVRKLYPEVPGMADYCVYWFNRAHHHLPECTAQRPERGRARLVGTQNIRNNKSREGGLDRIVASGTIVEAVDNQPWSGEANVHVSIANWVKHTAQQSSGSLPLEGRAGEGGRGGRGGRSGEGKPGASPLPNPPLQGEGTGGGVRVVDERALLIPVRRKLWFKVEPTAGAKKPKRRGSGPANKEYELNFRESGVINSALSDQVAVSAAVALKCNRDPQVVFNGQYPRHKGFKVTPSEAKGILEREPSSGEVLFPYLVGQAQRRGGPGHRTGRGGDGAGRAGGVSARPGVGDGGLHWGGVKEQWAVGGGRWAVKCRRFGWRRVGVCGLLRRMQRLALESLGDRSMSDAERSASEGAGADEQGVDQAGAEPVAAAPAAAPVHTPAELSRAMQAFKKRLKLTKLDSESKLGYGPMTGGRPSGIVAIEAPREYPRSVWEALVAQGKLKKASQGMYEMG